MLGAICRLVDDRTYCKPAGGAAEMLIMQSIFRLTARRRPAGKACGKACHRAGDRKMGLD